MAKNDQAPAQMEKGITIALVLMPLAVIQSRHQTKNDIQKKIQTLPIQLLTDLGKQ